MKPIEGSALSAEVGNAHKVAIGKPLITLGLVLRWTSWFMSSAGTTVIEEL